MANSKSGTSENKRKDGGVVNVARVIQKNRLKRYSKEFKSKYNKTPTTRELKVYISYKKSKPPTSKEIRLM